MRVQELFTYTATTQVDAIAVRPTSSTVASGSDSDEMDAPLLAVSCSALEGNVWDGGVVLVDGVSGERLCEAQFPTGTGAITWSGVDNDILAIGCDDGDIRLVRLAMDVDFAFIPEIGGGGGIAGHDDVVTGIAASKFQANIVASCSWDLTVKLWDITTMHTTLSTLDGHTDIIWDIAASPTTAHLLATASQDHTIQLWDERNVVPSATTFATATPALSLAWHPTNEHILSAGLQDGSVTTLDMRSASQPLSHLNVHDGEVHCLAYSPFHDDVLASGGDDTSVVILTNSSSPNATRDKLPMVPLSSHVDYIRSVAWYRQPPQQQSQRRRSSASSKSDSGNEVAKVTTCLATGSWDRTMRAWGMHDADE